jgi:formylglycine-generating enzyme required for sulfatase activity
MKQIKKSHGPLQAHGSRSLFGRADLLRILDTAGEGAMAYAAETFGYELQTPTLPRPPELPPELPRKPNDPNQPERLRQDRVSFPEWTPARTFFWRIERVEFFQSIEEIESTPIQQDNTQDLQQSVWRNRPAEAPPYPLLARWSNLVRRLRRDLTRHECQRSIDVEAALRRLSRGEQLANFPRKRQRRWGTDLQVVIDRSQRLTPYWHDQDVVVLALQKLYPKGGFVQAWISDGSPTPILIDCPGDRRPAYRLPPPGSAVLVLGDLGCLDRSGSSLQYWLTLGEQLSRNGNRATALLPCDACRWITDLSKDWLLLPWEQIACVVDKEMSSNQALANVAPIRRLLRLISPAIRIEPGFLRAVRQLLGPRFGAALEADVWQDPAVISGHSLAATLDAELAKQLRIEFDQEDEQTRSAVLDLLRRWRQAVAAEIWFEELLSVSSHSRALLPRQDEITEAERFYIRFEASRRRGDLPRNRAAAATSYTRRFLNRLPTAAHALQSADFRRARNRLWDLSGIEGEPPTGFDARDVPAGAEASIAQWRLEQCGDTICAIPEVHVEGSEALFTGSLLGSVSTLNHYLDIKPALDESFWLGGVEPTWAKTWGHDEYGSWVNVEVNTVEQRLRWIPAGMFTMGSPASEAGRYDDEGPQHQVTSTRGFWLFDTPCTQALWEAVTGSNPSKFKSNDRPVESIGWNEAQDFIEKLNALVPGLALTLPSEAQWEYACRAGIQTAIYSGDMDILGQCNAPALDPIAWYGGNSGMDFELAEGVDSSDWPEKQYDHKKAGTHSVAGKQANPWGLYDMLGNVWEWCQDGQREYTANAQTDPVGSLETEVPRVVRGGGWYDYAGLVRSAVRLAGEPDFRYYGLGFRCARVQQGEQDGAEPVLSKRGLAAEPRPAPDTPGEAVRLEEGTLAKLALPAVLRFYIQTDRERLTVATLSRPAWASAMGRDRFGLWAEFAVPDTNDKPVTQKLRWINPGRFLMGSPTSEPERVEREGPQHDVTLTQGYWVAETACTQALWLAVMRGDNPSHFKNDLRNPVEQISWHDIQALSR